MSSLLFEISESLLFNLFDKLLAFNFITSMLISVLYPITKHGIRWFIEEQFFMTFWDEIGVFGKAFFFLYPCMFLFLLASVNHIELFLSGITLGIYIAAIHSFVMNTKKFDKETGKIFFTFVFGFSSISVIILGLSDNLPSFLEFLLQGSVIFGFLFIFPLFANAFIVRE